MTDDQPPVEWFAGMFEGEGSIYISKPNGRVAGVLAVTLGNTDRALVEPFHDRYGGTIRVNNKNRPDAWAECYKWEVDAAAAVDPLEEMRPHFVSSVWRERADLALEIQSLKDDWYHSGRKTAERAEAYRAEVEPLVDELREHVSGEVDA